jgi:hypothetical protein
MPSKLHLIPAGRKYYVVDESGEAIRMVPNVDIGMDVIREENEGMYLRKSVQCIETGEIFASAGIAAKAIGQPAKRGTNIRSCCNGRIESAYGYHWKFVQEDEDMNYTEYLNLMSDLDQKEIAALSEQNEEVLKEVAEKKLQAAKELEKDEPVLERQAAIVDEWKESRKAVQAEETFSAVAEETHGPAMSEDDFERLYTAIEAISHHMHSGNNSSIAVAKLAKAGLKAQLCSK